MIVFFFQKKGIYVFLCFFSFCWEQNLIQDEIIFLEDTQN